MTGDANLSMSGTLSSVEACSLLRSNLARRLESFESFAEQVTSPLTSSLEEPDRRSDSEWQIYPTSEPLATKTKLHPRRPQEGSTTIWEKVFGRDKRGAGAVLRHKKERVRGDVRQATHVFKVVHPDGVQYRKTPNFEASSRVYTRRWWDTERTARGPDLGDVINVSHVLGNWVQVAGNGLWLPIIGRQQQALLELVNILGAYSDSPRACSTGIPGTHPSATFLLCTRSFPPS